MSVLIVEDERLVARMLDQFLKSAGLQTEVAYTGSRAWEILSSDEPPEVALIDWGLPEISGVELCHRVRERQDAPFTYLFLLTGRLVSSELYDDADEIITKPYIVERVVTRVERGMLIAQARRMFMPTTESH